MLQMLQLITALSCSLQISTFAFLLPYMKYGLEVLYLITQISGLIIRFSFVWLVEIAYQSSTIDICLLVVSLGITTKILIDAADLGFAAINVPSFDSEEDIPGSLPFFQSQFPYRNQNVPQAYEPLLSELSEKLREKDALDRVRERILNGNLGSKRGGTDSNRQASTSILEHASYLSLINDKDNFQASGCGWDLFRLTCYDLFGLCKGGCRDFSIAINSPIHDCRCVPVGYSALLKVAGR